MSRSTCAFARALGPTTVFALIAVACVAPMSSAQTAAPVPSNSTAPSASEEQAKFAVVGFLARQAAGSAFSSLMRWAARRYLDSSESSAQPAAATAPATDSNARLNSAVMPIPLAISRGAGFAFASSVREQGNARWVETPSQLTNSLSSLPPTTMVAASTRALFSATPVIQGEPDVPMEASKSVAPTVWGTSNYNGVQVTLQILDEQRNVREVAPLSRPLQAKDRFRLQITATFDALIALEAVSTSITRDAFTRSTPWQGRLYPQAHDRLVRATANEVLTLPLGVNEYFVADDGTVDSLILHIRHPQAVGSMSRAQPFYRDDAAQGSGFLQLIADRAQDTETKPALSQVILMHTSRKPPNAVASQ